jgi:hypothetical protein
MHRTTKKLKRRSGNSRPERNLTFRAAFKNCSVDDRSRSFFKCEDYEIYCFVKYTFTATSGSCKASLIVPFYDLEYLREHMPFVKKLWS